MQRHEGAEFRIGLEHPPFVQFPLLKLILEQVALIFDRFLWGEDASADPLPDFVWRQPTDTTRTDEVLPLLRLILLLKPLADGTTHRGRDFVRSATGFEVLAERFVLGTQSVEQFSESVLLLIELGLARTDLHGRTERLPDRRHEREGV